MTRMSDIFLVLSLICAGGCQVFKDGAANEILEMSKSPAEKSNPKNTPVETVAQATQSDATPQELPPPKQDDLPREAIPPERNQLVAPNLSPEATPRQRLDAIVPSFSQDQTLAPPLLQLERVKTSVVEKFPLIQSVMEEARIAAGKQQSARGVFDVKLVAESLNMPQGYYKNYRHAVKAEQATWMGGAIYGQYRIGNGDFQPWYGERETNDGGEFKLGLAAPLLRGRAIDERRAEIARADLQAAVVTPQVERQILESVQIAAYVYWSWVAAGQAYLVTQELLDVAEERDRAIRRQVELGNLPQTELQQNERLIASRQAKLIEANRKLQSSAIKLSLFLRDDAGDPILPSTRELPTRFPEPTDPSGFDLDSDISRAVDQRPELRELTVIREIVAVDLQQSENELLPNLTAVMEASKDVGGPASTKGDKTPFELEAGLLFDVPLQRNKAYGKIQSAQGKLSQLSLKREFTVNKIVSEVQDAHSAMIAAYERIGRTRQSVELARKLVKAEYRSFELGNSDVLRIAIQESAELDARYLEIEALLDYFQALAQYEAAVAIP
ncbi:Outer membrane efflux protein [Anatilimnocola aggregata]|uniref:Outer membrane efflux protein n=1 Tax=Anatilimnocola aggregata TaxID=2528021 RepID=A0A517YGC4_9BACT|nr:TolC family protein [Anatilimnocola aggregata]QDU29278.1 Outer membrane efflux protein [Anatilimnocola aggregata]